MAPRPLAAFTAFLAAYLGVIAWGWLPQGGTGGELLGHAAKILAILRLLGSGDFAWFPDYLTGSPSATLLSFALSVPIYAPGLLLAPSPLLGMKLTALVLLALAGFAAFAFGRRLSRDGWTGFAVAVAYLLSPQLLLRTGWQEHMTIVACFPLVPLAFLAMLRVAERGSPLDAPLLAASLSAALLAWAKMGATLALPLGAFAIWLFVSRPECRGHLVRGAAWAIPLTVILGVLPLLPLLRERAFMTVFELDPFANMQRAYSVKTGAAWLDRGGELFAVLPRFIAIDRGGYYLGLVGLAAVALVVIRTWRRAPLPADLRAMRLFLLLALGIFWLSFGPRTVLSGHFEFLGSAGNLPDAAIVLPWLTLAAQGALLYWCLPARRWKPPAFAAIFAGYLLLPAFPLIERLPLFADLRAPDSFWILNGTFTWAVAASLAAVHLVRTAVPARGRTVAAFAILVAVAADFSIYFRDFFKPGLGEPVFANYRAAGDHLAQREGRLYVGSGRYFYLDQPLTSGRPLLTEALNSYLMPATTMRLQKAGYASAVDMLTYFRLSGVGDALIERNDPDVSARSQDYFRMALPLGFENADFTVRPVAGALFPAFFAEAAIPAPAGYEEYPAALLAARDHAITVARDDGSDAQPPALSAAEARRDHRPPPLARLDLVGPRTAAHATVQAPGRDGWVVLSESWHPDWRAMVDGRPTPVFRGAGAFPAVPVAAQANAVEFRFQPPGWYAGVLGISATGWLLALGLFAAAPLLPRGLRETPGWQTAAPAMDFPRPPISRPLAIVPTFNEAASIAAILDAILAARADLHVLVVDDGSPDGTAAIVQDRPDFGDRVHLLARSGKRGLGSAYRAGFDWALDRDYDACLEIDADFSHDPADIPRLLAALDAGQDAAIGSRYRDGVRVINWPEHRLLLSASASRFVRLVTGMPLTDATSGFKAVRTAALRAIDRGELRADGYGFQIELHWLLWTRGARLTEIPIVFTERRLGQTKMTPAIAVEAAVRVLQLGARHLARTGGSVS